ncbi:Ig-like domain-containing protein [Lactococcus lactis]|uniref:Ig-like domain-containing protein n=1 Tax=Lactococcus lactis TaxID=1358 RepID=A0AAW7J114_9LACT|nr:Ig-like domain-containing protein [Lactococcus lactis]MDM7547306.1 Ig-like domain-containing protein [Lactococcus lactis]
MTLPNSGYTKTSSENFMINAGTIVVNVEWDEISKSFTGTPLGATSDGTKVNIEQKYRKIGVDGTGHVDVKGLWVLDEAHATVGAKLKELTAENMALGLNGTKNESAEYDGYTEIKSKRYLEEGDYIKNMAIVGKLTGSEKPIIILLDNVLTTSAFALETKDGDEAAIDYEGTANASFEQLQNDEFPWTILYPTDGTVAVTGVTLNKTTLSLAVGANETLTATIAPANATDKSGTYSSTDPSIATVTAQGKVVGVKAGTTNVKFTTSNGKTATCAVTVTTA